MRDSSSGSGSRTGPRDSSSGSGSRSGPRRILSFLLGTAVGAGVGYVFDPDMGATRRDRAREQMRSRANSATDTINRKLDYATDRITGTVANALPDTKPENDQALLAKVRSEVLGRPEWKELDVHVDAANGVVTLRGQVAKPGERDDIAGAVSSVTGVEEVVNLLHLPGEPPPNVGAARDATAPLR